MCSAAGLEVMSGEEGKVGRLAEVLVLAGLRRVRVRSPIRRMGVPQSLG